MGADEGTSRDTERATDPDETASSSTTGSAGTVASSVGGTTDDSGREGGAGEAIGRRFDSARNTLAQSGPKSQLTFVIGLFGVIGVGFGLTGIIAVQLIANNVGGTSASRALFMASFLISLLVVVLLTGPIVGAFSGLRIAERLNDDQETYLTSFIGTAVGYIVMVLVAALLVGLVASGSGGGTAATGGSTSLFSVSLLAPLLALAIPVGVTGLGSAFLARWNAGR